MLTSQRRALRFAIFVAILATLATVLAAAAFALLCLTLFHNPELRSTGSQHATLFLGLLMLVFGGIAIYAAFDACTIYERRFSRRVF